MSETQYLEKTIESVETGFVKTKFEHKKKLKPLNSNSNQQVLSRFGLPGFRLPETQTLNMKEDKILYIKHNIILLEF